MPQNHLHFYNIVHLAIMYFKLIPQTQYTGTTKMEKHVNRPSTTASTHTLYTKDLPWGDVKINPFGKTTITTTKNTSKSQKNNKIIVLLHIDAENWIAPLSDSYGNFVKNGQGNPEYDVRDRCFPKKLPGF